MLQTTVDGTTTDYVYGQERLVKLDGLVRTWYGGDALGSVRQTLDDAGAPLTTQHYDPWGMPEGVAPEGLGSWHGDASDARPRRGAPVDFRTNVLTLK